MGDGFIGVLWEIALLVFYGRWLYWCSMGDGFIDVLWEMALLVFYGRWLY